MTNGGRKIPGRLIALPIHHTMSGILQGREQNKKGTGKHMKNVLVFLKNLCDLAIFFLI